MKNERKYSLDVLRIAATVLIVFHHYQQITGAYFEGHINFWTGKFYFGYIVEFFFVLSGFFMCRYVNKIENGLGFKEFFFPRLARLLPLMLISGVVEAVFILLYEKVLGYAWWGIHVTIWGILINALGIQAGWVFANPMVNNPTWYISVLLLCYLIFYALTYLSKRWRIPCTYMFVFMVLLGCGIQTYSIELPFLNTTSARGLYAFFFGVLLSTIMDKFPKVGGDKARL